MAFEQHPQLSAHCDRLTMVRFTSAAGGAALGYHSPVLTPWDPVQQQPKCAAIPTQRQGAGSNDVTTAFQLIRRSTQLSLLLDPKATRTVLQAHPAVCQRLIQSHDDGQTYDILTAAIRKAGMHSMMSASVVRPKPSASTPTTTETTQIAVSSPPPVAVDGGGRRQRWQAAADATRAKDSEQPRNGVHTPTSRWQACKKLETTESHTGWRTVRRQHRHPPPTWALVDEWSVPIITQPKLNLAGACLCETAEQAEGYTQQLRGTGAPCALITRKKLEVPSHIVATRLAFHVQRTTVRSDQAGNENSEVQVLPTVGYAYQMSDVHSVTLRTAPQSMSMNSSGQTTVTRLLTSAVWAPEHVWEVLSKGKRHHMKEELIAQLQVQAPSKACKIYDVFKLERQNKLMTCCVRVDQDAVASVLGVSGKNWLFTHPLAAQNAQWPTVWAGETWPETLAAHYARSQDLGACGLSLGDRHIGYRCEKAREVRIRGTLGVAAKSSWVLKGVPMAFSSGDANALLGDLGLSQTVQEHTRKVMRTTQSWIILRPERSTSSLSMNPHVGPHRWHQRPNLQH